MASYRIYFFGETAIVGRHDFTADNDQIAIQIAHVLFDACSDDCRSFDLWQGARLIAVPRLFVPKNFRDKTGLNRTGGCLDRGLRAPEGLGDDRFPCCSQEDVAMTVLETPFLTSAIQPPAYAPLFDGGKQPEQGRSRSTAEFEEDKSWPVSEPAPSSWPRVFPGL